MRNGLLGSIAALAASAGLAFAQGPYPPPGPGLFGGPAAVAPNAIGQPPSASEPLNAPSPYGPDGTPLSAAEGLLGSGPIDAHPIERCWARGDYLLWGIKGGPSHFQLIVSGTIANGAVPGLPGAITLFGGRPFDFGEISGARFEVGTLLPGSNRIGVEADGLILSRKTINSEAASGPLGIPVLGRPFFNEVSTVIDSQPAASLANPGNISGLAYSMMWSAELNLFANLYRGQYFTWNVLTGFRHFNLAEGIRTDSNRVIGSAGQTFLGNPLPIGSQVAVEDKFDTFNHFYGWNIGGNIEYRWRCLALDVGLQVAIGDVRRSATRQGFTEVTTTAGGVTTVERVPGGLLAGITNLNRQADNSFEAVPELRIDLFYQLSRHVRVGFGYTAMDANNVIRPGNTIDPIVNPTLVPFNPGFGQAYGAPLGTARPQPTFRAGDYWAQGVNWSLLIAF